jgi:sugar transferase (PEP-CTERM/EpsH1 system associated)
MKILYLSHRIPYPPNKGDKIRSFNEIKYLSQRHEIHLACLADDPKDLKYEEELRKYCKAVRVVLIKPQLAKLKSIFYLLTGRPLSIPYFYSRKLQRTIDHLLMTIDFDVIFCFSSPMAEYVIKSRLFVSRCLKLEKSLMKGPPVIGNEQRATSNQKPETSHEQPKLIMDFVDVDSDKWTQYSKYARFPMSWIYALEGRKLANYEKKVAESFDHSIFVTEAEKRIFERKNPHIQNISVITNGVDLDYFSPKFSQRQAPRSQRPETINQQPVSFNQPPATRNEQPIIVFTGAMDYYANIDGVVWFAIEILPLIKKEIPEIQFFIVGSNPTKEVLSLSSNNGVTVTGYVPDTREYLNRATVVVVPLRIARGIQNKILEAMAMGIPVVATPQAFEGINANIGGDLLADDEPGAFAQAVVRLLRDPTLRNELRNNARHRIEANYSWPRNLAKLNEIVLTASQPPTTTNERPATSNQRAETRNQRRVLMLLTNAFDPDPRVHQEARALAENGYAVTILCWDRDYKLPSYDVIDGIKVERIYVKSTHGRGATQAPFLFLFWLKAYARASVKDFDIVHCHDFDTLPLGYILSKQKKAKLVYDAHESYVDMLINVPIWLKKAIYKTENFLLRRIDLLITVGEILKENFEKRGVQHSCVVGNWKDPDEFKFPQEVLEEERQRLLISNGQLVISFIANLGKERQIEQLVEAVKDIPRITLIVGGKGPSAGVVKDAAQKYSNIVYLGYVHPSKVPLYTAISDAIFYGFDPSNPNAKYSAPNKLFEALAAGKAVLTGDFGEIGRIVKDTECGLIIKEFTEEEIKKNLSNLSSEILNRFKKNSKKNAMEKYNWQNAHITLLDKYGHLSCKVWN